MSNMERSYITPFFKFTSNQFGFTFCYTQLLFTAIASLRLIKSMSKLRAWIREKFPKSKHASVAAVETIPDGYPLLPSVRRHSLSFNPKINLSMAPFFQKLPTEIRRKIYLCAFGGKIIHLDLDYQHPYSHGPCHARMFSNGTDPFDTSVPKAWRWWSCVCHSQRLRAPPGFETQLYLDECRRGGGDCNYNDGGLIATTAVRNHIDCFIGAMGWLLSCCQAYSEAVDVVYSSNTFEINKVYLTAKISRLLAPQNLFFITSLEFSWDVSLYSDREHQGMSNHARGWSIYQDLMSKMNLITFPKLKRLLIIVENLVMNSELLPKQLLAPSDRIVEDYDGRLERFFLQLHPAFFNTFREKMKGIEVVESGQGAFALKKLWRELPRDSQSQLVGGSKQGELGYFVFKGIDNVLRPQVLL
ncbi:hypothetical protein VTL71DRAFT_14835 [Oculimacula yallundae]|uniref:DUF7730 domain-containing protein n=1 Tax=Oculimacula yallundae TaxID=86028 RepID=A0ABR4CH44_9HELO